MAPWTFRLAAAWLKRRLPHETWSATLGDLSEEFPRRARAGGRWHAERWFVREAWSVGRAYRHAPTPMRGTALGRLGRDMSAGTREAARCLRRDPLYASIAAISLGVGVAAVLSTIGLSGAILLRPLNPSAPSEVRRLAHQPAAGSMGLRFSFAELELIRAHSDAHADVGAGTLTPALLRAGTTTTQDMVDVVTGPYHDIIGAQALIGRGLAPDDDQPGRPRVIVLNERYWRGPLGAPSDIVGRPIGVNNVDYTVVGVAPTMPSLGFFGTSAAGWVPAATADSLLPRGWRTDPAHRAFVAIARLAPGAGPAALDSALQSAAGSLATAFPDWWRDRRLTAEDGLLVFGSLRRAAVVVSTLLGVLAVLVLIVAVTNVAGLVHAQWSVRRHAAGVRWALGAGRRSVAAPILCEGALIGLAAGGVALVLYRWLRAGADSLALLPTVALQIDLPWDARLAALTLAAATVAGVLMTAGPAWSAARMATGAAATLTGRAPTARASGRARRVLLATQLAASLVLVVLAVLFTRSLGAMRDAPIGVDVDRLAAFDFDIEPVGVRADRLDALAAEAVARVRAMPGVSGAAMAGRAPVDASTPSGVVRVGTTTLPDVTRLDVTEGYFAAVGVSIASGRAFSLADAGLPVAIVNETLAARLEGKAGFVDDVSGRRLTVVGVARDSRYRSISEPPQPHFYVPVAPAFHLALLVRAAGDPAPLLSAVQKTLDATGPGIQGFFPRTGRDHLRADLLTTSAASFIARVLGGIAAGLAALGLYGVLLWLVQARRGEIGLRMALGAGRHEVQWFIVAQALRSAWPGVAAGAAVALAAAWALRSQWYGVSVLDPLVVLAVVGIQGTMIVVATWIPARRATRVSPTELLR